jgi:hypothetical protein
MSGTEANRSGGTLETQVGAALRTNGIAFRSQHVTKLISVLGKEIRSDFYLPRAIGFEEGLHIEVRWQDSSGSVDEKICYLKENIESVYVAPAIVVIDGSQVQAQYDYLKSHRGEKLLDVMRLTEFLVFANSLRTGDARRLLREAYDPDQGVLFA